MNLRKDELRTVIDLTSGAKRDAGFDELAFQVNILNQSVTIKGIPLSFELVGSS